MFKLISFQIKWLDDCFVFGFRFQNENYWFLIFLHLPRINLRFWLQKCSSFKSGFTGGIICIGVIDSEVSAMGSTYTLDNFGIVVGLSRIESASFEVRAVLMACIFSNNFEDSVTDAFRFFLNLFNDFWYFSDSHLVPFDFRPGLHIFDSMGCISGLVAGTIWSDFLHAPSIIWNPGGQSFVMIESACGVVKIGFERSVQRHTW